MISTWQFYQIFVLWIIMSSSLNVGGRRSLLQEDFLWKCGHLYTTRWEHILLFCIFPIKFCILIESWSRCGDALLTLSADDDDEVFSNHNSFYNLRLNEGFLSQHPTCVPTPRNEKIGCLLVPSKRTHDSTVTNVLENEKKKQSWCNNWVFFGAIVEAADWGVSTELPYSHLVKLFWWTINNSLLHTFSRHGATDLPNWKNAKPILTLLSAPLWSPPTPKKTIQLF